MGLGLPASVALATASDPSQNTLLAFQALQLLPQFVNFPNSANDGKSNDDNMDYSVKFSYALNDFTSIYGASPLVLKHLLGISQEIQDLLPVRSQLWLLQERLWGLIQQLELDMLILKKLRFLSLAQRLLYRQVI
jgi:hypothetical protein